VFLNQMLEVHRSRDAALTMLIKQPTEQPGEIRPAKPKANKQTAFDYIALDAKKERVLILTSSTDVGETFTVTKSLLKRYPHIKIFSGLQDAHFYIFSHWVLDLFDSDPLKKKISRIKADLVPYLISVQSSTRKQQDLPESAFSSSQSLASSMASTRQAEHPQPNTQIQQQVLQRIKSLSAIAEISTPITRSSLGRSESIHNLAPVSEQGDPHIGCFAHVMTSGYCMRATTLQNYMEMNRDIARAASKFLPWEQKGKNNFIHESASIHPQTQVGADCVVGQGSKIGERCSVKKSIIGRHCQIGDNVKITNSVIMDYVVIGNNCNITESILCDGVHMKEQCNIKDSQIGVGYFLISRSDIKNEVLSKDLSG